MRLSDRGFTSARGLSYTFEGTATALDAALPITHSLGGIASSMELWREVSAGVWEQVNSGTYVRSTSTQLTTTGTTLASGLGGSTNVRLVAATGAIALSTQNVVLNGGNSFGSALTIGTNDNFALNLETNGSTKLSIDAAGNVNVDSGTLFVDATNNRVGIGTPSPDSLMEVRTTSAGANIAKFADGANNRALIIESSVDGMKLITTEETDEADSDRALIFQRGESETGRISATGAWTLGPSAGGVSHDVWLGSSGDTNGRGLNAKSAGALGNNGANAFRAFDGTTDERAAVGVYKHSGIASAVGFLNLRNTDGTSRFFYTESGNLYTTPTAALIGTTSGTLIGGPSMGYETGTFTPATRGTTVAGTGTYTTQLGYYTRIGNMVWFSATVEQTAHTGTGNVEMTGLPFTSINSSQRYGFVNFSGSNLTKPANSYLYAFIPPNASHIELQTGDTAGTTATRTDLAMDTSASYFCIGVYTCTF